uniref:Uncharacterized protein n=1 Tax=Ascaris lumbricoides TaxID=6252 RepID=A0A0M3IRC1_ASCLU
MKVNFFHQQIDGRCPKLFFKNLIVHSHSSFSVCYCMVARKWAPTRLLDSFLLMTPPSPSAV